MSDQQPAATSNGAEATPKDQGAKTPPTAPAGEQTPRLPQTQEEFDRAIETRLARERKRFADYDELKAKAADYDKLQESMLSEQEKAVKAAREEGATEIAQKYQQRLVAADVRATAAALDFRDPSDALAHLNLNDLISGDDVDTDKVKKSLDDLAKSKPYLLNTSEQPPKRRSPRIRRPAEDGSSDSSSKSRNSAQLLRQFNRGE